MSSFCVIEVYTEAVGFHGVFMEIIPFDWVVNCSLLFPSGALISNGGGWLGTVAQEHLFISLTLYFWAGCDKSLSLPAGGVVQHVRHIDGRGP